MIKASKKKIVFFIILFLAAFLLCSIGVIYGVSYYSVYKENREIVSSRAERYADAIADESTREEPQDNGNFMRMLEENGLSLTMFYAVSFDKSGTVKNVMNIPYSSFSDEEIVETAKVLLTHGKMEGIFQGKVYRHINRTDFDALVWMDNPTMTHNMKTLLRNTVIFGLIFILLMMPFAIWVSHVIFRPIEEKEQEQRIFLSNAEHELKTPITTIGANAELLSREIGENEWLSAIRQENKRMGNLVGDLLKLSRAESVTPDKKKISLSKLVLGGILPYEAVAFDAGNEIRAEITDDVIVMGDEGELSELVAILTDNALSHASGNGDIQVSLKKEKGHAVLAVSNPGEAISKEDRDHIFERFYRVDSSKAKDGHFGLGLPIARAIVEAHSGEFSVNSNETLTTFTVRLPVEQ